MSKAFECEVCGELFKGEPTGKLALFAPPDNYYFTNMRIRERHNEDVCSGCCVKIGAFLRQLADGEVKS